MKPTDAERDPAFDRLIARGLEGETDVSGRACPDADLLAAWFDRSLSRSEAERIETHAAGCGSCQQILADLARSEPEVIRAAPVPSPATAVALALALARSGDHGSRSSSWRSATARCARRSRSPSLRGSRSPSRSVRRPPPPTRRRRLRPVAPAETPAEAARKDDAPLARSAGTPQSKGSARGRAAPAGGGVGGRLQTDSGSLHGSGCSPGADAAGPAAGQGRRDAGTRGVETGGCRSRRRRRCGPKRTLRLRLRPARPRRRWRAARHAGEVGRDEDGVALAASSRPSRPARAAGSRGG